MCIDVVVPVFNEAAGVAEFHRTLKQTLALVPHATRVLYVNDGSTDATDVVLNGLAADDPTLCILELSRNFGHQAALTAGLDLADGDAVVTMDGDGQHPPELIPELVALWEHGFDIVLTQRENDRDLSALKRETSRAFYALLNRLGNTSVPPRAADFRLMSRPAVEALRNMREYHRFLRAMVSWMGFRTVIIPYAARARGRGRTKFSMGRMLKMAADAIFSFSLVPLHLALLAGVVLLAFAGIEIVYVSSFWLTGRHHLLVPGWSSLMFVILAVGGLQMILLGFVGLYVGLIYQEAKRRPIYVVRRRVSSDRHAAGEAATVP